MARPLACDTASRRACMARQWILSVAKNGLNTSAISAFVVSSRFAAFTLIQAMTIGRDLWGRGVSFAELAPNTPEGRFRPSRTDKRSEEHTSELQSLAY